MLSYFIESDVYEGPRSDSNNNDDERRDQQNVNKCIRYNYSEREYKIFISISYILSTQYHQILECYNIFIIGLD